MEDGIGTNSILKLHTLNDIIRIILQLHFFQLAATFPDISPTIKFRKIADCIVVQFLAIILRQLILPRIFVLVIDRFVRCWHLQIEYSEVDAQVVKVQQLLLNTVAAVFSSIKYTVTLK